MKKSCLIAVIATLAAVLVRWLLWLFICAAVRRSWTSTSVCSLARTMQKRSSRKLPKRHLPRMLQNKPNTGHTKEAHRQSDHRLRGCAFLLHKRRRT